ncbi:MAG TPA: DUF5709 domain-containing protein [Lapillicoccus sp.]|jgi:hypothetical protein|nr:DUF5709 domain-containing protein [Lapillicoccus sp.]
MSDESYSAEELNTDTGSYSLDDEDQLESEDTLVDRGVDNVLDEGYSPPEKPLGVDRWGTTAWEQSQDETIDQRIQQEEPDPNTAYGAPDNESGLDEERGDMVGGDDPDAIPAENDFVGDMGQRAGRLVDPDEGVREDQEKDLVAEDVGISGAGASAEEAAMHIVADDIGVGDLGVDDEADTEGLTEVTATRIQTDDPANERDSIASSHE